MSHASITVAEGLTMADYLAVPAVPAVSRSWMVDPALLRAGAWDEVTARSAHAVALATAARPDR